MKSLFIYLLCFSISFTCAASPLGAEKANSIEFAILIASYNNEKYVIENLQSACFQKSTNPYHVYYVNDCSTDRTAEMVESFIREHQLESLVTVIHNTKNVGPLENYYNTIHNFIPNHKVVVNLDGDDFLAHDNVLLTLEKYYANPNLWMTYGSALEYPSMKNIWWIKAIPDDVIRQRKFRKFGFVTHHLRTFKAGLFKKIKKEDLMYKGSFIRFSGDLAFMMPMLELCAPYPGIEINHSQSIPEILYYWRVDNPINDFRAHRNEQNEIQDLIEFRPIYDQLRTLED